MVADVLLDIGLAVTSSPPGTPGYDIGVTGEIEVKTDLRAGATGNVAVEVAYRGCPSGLRTTTAGGWAYVIGADIYLLSVASLRALVDAPGVRRVPAGEGATVALVRLDDLRRVARVIDTGRRGEK